MSSGIALAALLPLMPRAVALVCIAAMPPSVPRSRDKAAQANLHFAMPLDGGGRAEPRASLQDHGPHVTCYRKVGRVTVAHGPLSTSKSQRQTPPRL
jgi:hypothetical protein